MAEFIGCMQKMWRSEATNRAEFIKTVKKGDILICSYGVLSLSGMVGHAAIMVTDNWVLEMPGGQQGGSSLGSLFSRADQSLDDNNQRISKERWYDAHKSERKRVYRCPDKSIANMAADWAYTHYYNPSGGEEKTIHIRYSVATSNFEDTNPSYCSKLVLQAYLYGTGSANVISFYARHVRMKLTIVPLEIPGFFNSKYEPTLVAVY